MDNEKTPPPAVEPWHLSRMLLRNAVSLAGVALGIVSIANIFIFFLIDQIATKPGPYIGILAYMVAPGFLVFGLILVPIGVYLSKRHIREGLAEVVLDRKTALQRLTGFFWHDYSSECPDQEPDHVSRA